jgi:hypothetical protein
MGPENLALTGVRASHRPARSKSLYPLSYSGRHCCEEDVITECGLYLLSVEKREKRKYWIHNVFRGREGEGEFHTVRASEGCRAKVFKHLIMSTSKFENLKQLLHTDLEKKNTRGRLSITTEERLALSVRFTHSLHGAEAFLRS